MYIYLRKTLPLSLFFLLFFSLALHAQNRYTLTGTVSEENSHEHLIGATIQVKESAIGTTTNSYGFFSLSLPPGTYTLIISYVGYQTTEKSVELKQHTQLNINLKPGAELDEVEVSANNPSTGTPSVRVSTISIPTQSIKQLPALMGEKDLLKVIQLLPGVQSGAEGNTGMYVRGGGADQNLIILDDAPVYNANHLFGFLSIFNGDALKSIQLTKGGFPARYGGRLSSVLEINMKDGNKEKTEGEIGIGLIASRGTLEIPIVKRKSSLILAARRTYIDLLLKPFTSSNDFSGYFYDMSVKFNYEINPKSKIYVSAYLGRDSASGSDSYTDQSDEKWGFNWGNATGTFRWNKILSDKIFCNTSLIFSNYVFRTFSTEKNQGKETYSTKYQSKIQDFGAKQDLLFAPLPQYTLRTGWAVTLHKFTPSAILIKEESSQHNSFSAKTTNTVESAAYIENEMSLMSNVALNAGIRFSHYFHPQKSYLSVEPRITSAISLPKAWNMKASYAIMNQYVHLLTSSGASLPMDLWVPTTKEIKPQQAKQFAVGLEKDLFARKIFFSIEGYYKTMKNTIGYAPGSNFLLVEEPESIQQYSWEENTIQGKGNSYGIETFIQRKVGRLSGWIGYTLSWTRHQFKESNNGRKFYPRFDRRHDIAIVGIYKPSTRITLSGNWVYGTGNAISIPTASYKIPQTPIRVPNHISSEVFDIYNRKNDFRAPSYHRLDVGIQVHTKGKRTTRTWDFSIYNIYNRKNPFFIKKSTKKSDTATSSHSKEILKQYSIFPFLPSVTYNLKF